MTGSEFNILVVLWPIEQAKACTLNATSCGISDAMKMKRRDFLVGSASACVLANAVPTALGHNSSGLKPTSIQGKKVTVYTTAEKTDHRLSATDAPTFKRMGQPLETQVCVFVDPTKTYQTFLGIGGALTDASA